MRDILISIVIGAVVTALFEAMMWILLTHTGAAETHDLGGGIFKVGLVPSMLLIWPFASLVVWFATRRR